MSSTDSPSATRTDALVMFGLTGDLGATKLFPALYELADAGLLDIRVIGVGRSEYTDDELRKMFHEALEHHEPADGRPVDMSVVDRIELGYLSGDSAEPATFDALAERLGDAASPLVYAALPPHLFGGVAAGMSASAFSDGARLMVEKPFGSDVESAKDLWDEITGQVAAEQLFVVDHFLAKAAVENMATVRHVNALITNSLDAAHVSSIDLEMAEAGGVDGRGSFYEGVGAIADVVQNHLLQTLALLLMEHPDDDSVDAYRSNRSALLSEVQPVDPRHVVLGQYDGYRDHDGVADDSTIETFASMRLSVDNPRWAGVPINLWTGKKLSRDHTAATFHLVDTAPSESSMPNRIRFEIKPAPSVSFDIGVLDPDSHDPRNTTVYACGPEDHGELDDYATLFASAFVGDQRHFAHIDGIVEAWRILAPIRDAEISVQRYEPGSDGPDVGVGRVGGASNARA